MDNLVLDINDDGVTPVLQLSVTVKMTQTTDLTYFEGSVEDINNQIVLFQSFRDAMMQKVSALPERKPIVK